MDRPQRLFTRTDRPAQENHNIMGGQSQVSPHNKGIHMALFSDNGQEINRLFPSGFDYVEISMLPRGMSLPKYRPPSMRTTL